MGAANGPCNRLLTAFSNALFGLRITDKATANKRFAPTCCALPILELPSLRVLP